MQKHGNYYISEEVKEVTTSTSTLVLDLKLNKTFFITLGANLDTLTLNNIQKGYTYHFVFIQGGTMYTVSLPAAMVVNGDLEATINQADTKTGVAFKAISSSVLVLQGSPKHMGAEANDAFRTTPSSVIIAGNNIAWNGNTLDVETVGGGGILSKTYAEAETLRAASGLSVGQAYRITDYKTTHEIPYNAEIHNGPTEALIIIANALDSFYEKAISTVYPQDEIWYDFEDNLCEDDTTPRTGRITYRKDTQKEIECFYDWREVIFRRWQCAGLYHHAATLNVNTFEATIIYGTVDSTPNRYREYYIDFGTAAHTANPQLQLTKTNVVTKELVRPDGTSFTGVDDLQTYLGTSNFGLVYYSPLLDKYVVVDNEVENNMVKDKYILFQNADATIGNGTRLVVNTDEYTDGRTFVDADPAITSFKIGKALSGYNYNNIRFDSLSEVHDTIIEDFSLNASFPHGRCKHCRISSKFQNNIVIGKLWYAKIGNEWINNLIASSGADNRCAINSSNSVKDNNSINNSFFTRGHVYGLTFANTHSSTYRLWGSGAAIIWDNTFEYVQYCFFNFGLISSGLFKHCTFESIYNKAFEGGTRSWVNVNYSPASSEVESYDFDLLNTNYDPYKILRSQVITDTNLFTVDDEEIVVGNSSGDHTVDLPAAPFNNREVIVREDAGNTMTVDGNGKDIGSASTLDISGLAYTLRFNTVLDKWVVVTGEGGGGGTPEGTAVKSTGETGAVKFLREDGDGTSSWQVPAGSGNVIAVNTPVDNDFAKFTSSTTIEGRSYAEVRSDLNVEDGATADQTGAEIKTAYEAEANAYTDTKDTKLGGIEASATADQTGAEIKTAYEAEANAYTDTKDTKLGGIEASATADQTGAEIKAAYEAEADTNAYSDSEKIVVGNTSNTNSGNETATSVAAINHGTAEKTSLVDADEITGQDSASSFSLIRTTWTNVKAFLKTYFDTLYAAASHTIASHSDTTATGAELNELTDGSTTTLHSHAGGGGGINVKAITIENPTGGEDITMFFTDVAITITQLNAIVANGSATPSVTWTIRHGTDRSAVGAEVVTSGTTTTSASTGSEVTSFDDATIVAGSWIWIETTAQSGTVPELNVTIEYTID